ncbi:MAG: hypothetical protein ACLFRX_10280 [Gemmatimonadota bacterium]
MRTLAERRLARLLEEFTRRQRESPTLVVRPWWWPGAERSDAGRGSGGAFGFVVEYCPAGEECAEIAVRVDRVRVEGPTGAREARLDLAAGWRLGSEDVGYPETLANHLLRLADRVLNEAA